VPNLNELLKKQEAFDMLHRSNFDWSEKISDDNIAILEHIMLSMVGEFGEAANIVKKVVRGDSKLSDVKESLSEEIIDILIYVLKLIYQLDIDVDAVYDEKMKRNLNRFEKYGKEKPNG